MESSSPSFQTEKRADGSTGVALFQPMPKPAVELIKDPALVIQLLTANGLEDIKHIDLSHKIEADTTHHVQRAFISFQHQDINEPIEVIIKFNQAGTKEAIQSCAWREAYFYSKILPEHLKDFSAPKCLLALADQSTGQQFIIIQVPKESFNARKILMYALQYGEKDMEQLGGPKCSLENTCIQIAENLAILHSSTYILTNKTLIAQTESITPSSQWVQGKGKDTFEKGKESVKQLYKKTLEKANAIQPKVGMIPELFSAAIDKIDFDAYYTSFHLHETNGTPYALIHGEVSLRDFIWSKTTETISCIDFEYMGYGPIISDLVQLFLQLGTDLRIKLQDKVLLAYHSKLTQMGKIDTSIYTLDRLTQDFKNYFVSSSVVYLSKFNLKFNRGVMIHFINGLESVIKEANIDKDTVLPAIFNNVQALPKPVAPEFDIQMETGPDGNQRVKIFQPMPFTLEHSMNDDKLLKKLLVANGLKDIENVEFADKIQGGLSQEVAVATCTNVDGSKFKVFLKANAASAGVVQGKWREAMFYAEIYQHPDMECLRKDYPLPKCHLAMVDKDQSRQFFVLDFMDPSSTVQYEKIIGCNNGKYYGFDNTESSNALSEEEVCGAGVTKMMTYMSMVDVMAALHYHSWCDESVLTKFPYLRLCNIYQGQGREEFEKKVNTIGVGLQKFLGEDGDLAKEYPELVAVFKACIAKAHSYDEFQKCYVQDKNTPFSMVHSDTHEKQFIWSKPEKQAYLIDLELMGISPPISDICYFVQNMKMSTDIDEEQILSYYHQKLSSFGEKTKDYTFEQMRQHYIQFYIPKNLHVAIMVNGYFKNHAGKTMIKNANDHIKKHGITPENVYPWLIQM